MKKFMIKVGSALIRHAGYRVHMLAVDERLMACARLAIAECERVALQMGGQDLGQWKRQEASRMLSQMMPTVREHDRINAIQMAIEEIRGAR